MPKLIQTQPGWTLFLDRDGVINRRLPGDYVKRVDEFEFLPGVLQASKVLAAYFGRIIVVTNQQGIGKGLMSEEDLRRIHDHMVAEIEMAGGRIDAVLHCPKLESENAECRKPNTGMAEQARDLFPEIQFKNAVMIGDSDSDMEFAVRLQMPHVFIGSSNRWTSTPSLFDAAIGITNG